MDGDILNIGAGLAIGLGAIGPGIGIGLLGSKAMEANLILQNVLSPPILFFFLGTLAVLFR